MAQTLSQIKDLLRAHGLQPKHRFGQNFLHDGNALERIMLGAGVTPGRIVLEVGPGTGTLTERLLEAGARVLAVEIDRDLAPILVLRLGLMPQNVVEEPGTPEALNRPRPNDRATLYLGDILQGKHTIAPAVAKLLHAMAPSAAGPPPFALIANLPYHVASPLLANLCCDFPSMTHAVVMVQREVADRLAAPPGGKDYGPLGILIQATCRVRRLFVLSPGAFWPPPSIDSAVVLLERRPDPLTQDLPRLSRALHALFSKRRKQVGAILGRATQLPQGVSPELRPERLTPEQLVEVSRLPCFD